MYNLLVDLALRAATDLGVDCDQISFTAVLVHARAMLTAAAPCPGCGHQPQLIESACAH